MVEWTKEELEAVDFVLENLYDPKKCVRKLITLNKQSRDKIAAHLKKSVELQKKNFDSLTRKVVNRSSELPTLVNNKQAITPLKEVKNMSSNKTKAQLEVELAEALKYKAKSELDTAKANAELDAPSNEGITEKDLLGIKTISVLRKKAQPVDIPGQKAKKPSIIGVIQEGEYVDKEHKWGLITQAVVDKVLASATRDGSGDIIVQLPEPEESEIAKGMTWVNYL